MFKDLLLSFLLRIVRALVMLRYKVTVKGLEEISPETLKKPGGILFLPNHPAEIDPVILESVLWKKFQPRPLVVEHFYYLKGFRFFMDLVKALPLPTMDALANKWRGKKVEKQFAYILEALKRKGRFLIYPSGRLKVTGRELIGGASFVHRLVQECPDCNIVLVRTSGLWGSQFSRAITGSSPDFGRVLRNCVKILLKNGIFFAPRREVLVEFALPPDHFPIFGSRLEFNKALEDWYNRYPEGTSETLKRVSFAFWREDLPVVSAAKDGAAATEERPVSKKIQQEVFSELASLCGKAVDQIDRKMHLSQDLGLDSLDVAGIYLFLDERYQVKNLIPGDLLLVEDVLQAAAGYRKEREALVSERGHAPRWPEEGARLPPHIGEWKTVQEAFLRSADRNGALTACADALSGALSYRKVKIAALLLSAKFSPMAGSHIGVMLPSSVGTYVTILALLLAGKTPVMLNWTVGVRALDHAADLTELQTVITSSKFLDRLENGELGKIEERLCFLEEIKESIRLKDKLRALFLSLFGAESLLRRLRLDKIPSSSPAVILFTSGTETLPKGVPLSHMNLLSNQRACLEAAGLKGDDILYGVLPPFHSFGFSVTGLLPLVSGLKVCYAPDPTDSHGLAHDIDEWKPTLFCCAPSFIKALFRVARPEQLRSLRYIVAGAEKAMQELFDYVKENLPDSKMMEGYGITECSPVVTIDRPTEPHRGVGRPVSGVELATANEEGTALLPCGQEGEVCIAGPNVFEGYYRNPRNPFALIGGKKWYLSGDRGYVDEGGHLILSGRLKRFVKIGGEMVGLGGLEEELLRLAKEKNWVIGQEEGPPLAVSVKEKESGKPEIILFTTFAISTDSVNAALKECGHGRIVKIAQVRVLDQIPLTGTGKTHYRILDEITD